MTPCRFALACVGVPAHPPPPNMEYRGPDTHCSVCGDPAVNAWLRVRALSDSFGPTDSYYDPGGPAVCDACVYFSVGGTFQDRVKSAGLGVKLWSQCSWRSYGHLFRKDHHSIPRAADWRDLLLDPPEPPFMAVVSTSGQKNLIYRAPIAHSRDLFPIRVEGANVLVHHQKVVRLFSDFEAGLADGVGREALLTGNVGSSRATSWAWERHDGRMRFWRRTDLPLLRLAHMFAKGRERKQTMKEAA